MTKGGKQKDKQTAQELSAARRFIALSGCAQDVKSIEPGNPDPPDIQIVFNDGTRLGLEVTHWSGGGGTIHDIDRAVIGRVSNAFPQRDHANEVWRVRFVQSSPHHQPTIDDLRRDQSKIADGLVTLLRTFLSKSDEKDSGFDVPEDHLAHLLYSQVTVSRRDRNWCAGVVEQKGLPVDQAAVEMRDKWEMGVARIVIANVPEKGEDAQRLREIISAKSADLPKWPEGYGRRWLLVVMNDPEMPDLTNMRWLDRNARKTLRALIPENEFDGVAFVPMFNFPGGMMHAFRRGTGDPESKPSVDDHVAYYSHMSQYSQSRTHACRIARATSESAGVEIVANLVADLRDNGLWDWNWSFAIEGDDPWQYSIHDGGMCATPEEALAAAEASFRSQVSDGSIPYKG
jgi:hypothetical protein